MIRRCSFGLLCEAGGIIVRAHPGHAGPGDHHAPGEQLIPRRLPHRNRLPGEQGLIRLELPLQHQGVRRDLHPALQREHVPQYQFFHRKLPRFAIPQGTGFWRGQDGDLLHQLFGVELLHNSDDGVQSDDQNEQQIRPRTHQGQRDGNEDVEQIEQGAYILTDDLSGGLGDGGRRRRIAAPHLPQPFCLCVSQAVKG